MSHEFKIEKEISLAAPPEQVWEAIATGQGLNSWFMGSANEVEPGQGGTMLLAFDDAEPQPAAITAWDPPRRLAYRGATSPDGVFHAFEYLIEARGGTTTVRLVHSGVLGDDWEGEYDALNEGDFMYLHKLAQYVLHFAGRPVIYVQAFLPTEADNETVLASFRSALGLGDSVTEGDKARVEPAGLAAVDGVVDFVSPSIIGVRTDDGLYRFLHAMGTVFLGHHIYRDDVDRDEVRRAWTTWLEQLFA